MQQYAWFFCFVNVRLIYLSLILHINKTTLMRKQKFIFLVNLLFCCQLLIAQTSEITGKVTDANGAPLGGASIRVKNSRVGTSAGIDGTFKINAAPNATLVISAVGYETMELNIGSQNSITATLAVDTKAMSEVVVTGTGVAVSKKKLAFAVEGANISNQPKVANSDIGQQLVGQIPGAQISSTNGQPGRPVNILLRGINTLRSGTSPMILIDGVEVRATDLQSLDLSNIERYEVVQGAASATIYGAQGANGVIQLFTKKGKQGKINIDISTGYAVGSLLNVGDLQKAKFHAFVTDANNVVSGTTTGVALAFNPTALAYTTNLQYNALNLTSVMNKAYDQNLKWYDHYDQLLQTSKIYNNSITISGARDKVDFNFGLSNNKQNSTFLNNGDFNRSNFSSNIGVELFKNFRLRSTTQLIYTKNTMLDQTGRGIFYSINNARPFADFFAKDPDGNYGGYLGDAVGVNHYNINFQNQYSNSVRNKVDVIQNFNANYKVNKFLELDAKYGMNYQNDERFVKYLYQGANRNQLNWANPSQRGLYNYVNPGTNLAALLKSGENNDLRFKTVFQNFLATATIRTDFERDFNINLPIKTSTLVGFDHRKNVFQQYITYGAQAPSYTPYATSQMGVYGVVSDFKEPFITYGYVLDQKIDWGEIGGVTGGFRSDYSSAFGRGSKPFTFPHAGAYYRLSSMNFWQNSSIAKTIPEFKIRTSWGKAGIQPGAFDRYVVLDTRNLGTTNSFAFPVAGRNPDLNVEVSEEFEIGTDLSVNMLKGSWLKSLDFKFTYWKRDTKDAIWDIDAAPSTGIGTIRDNAFGLSSKGLQASISFNILNNKKFNWTFVTNFSRQNSIISSVKGEPIVVTSSAGSSNYILRAGEQVGQLYGFRLLRAVDEIGPNGNPYIPKADQGLYTLASNGWVVSKATYQPYSGPLEALGDPNPKFNMSFINDVTFKGFLNINMQWDWLEGNNLYNQTKSWMYRDGIHKDYDLPITLESTTGSVTGAYTAFYRGVYQAGAFNGTKNYFMEDASFFRLRNLSIATDFARIFKVKPFSKLQLVFSGRNMVTFTKYTGMDPEVSSGTANSSFDRGVDHNTVPNLKTYQVTLNLGF
jgi:TonB-dependent starch-binding outer membrane protein SusC